MDQNPQFMFDLWTQLFLWWNATIIVPLVSQILLLSWNLGLGLTIFRGTVTILCPFWSIRLLANKIE